MLNKSIPAGRDSCEHAERFRLADAPSVDRAVVRPVRRGSGFDSRRPGPSV